VLGFNGTTWTATTGVGTDQAFDSILFDVANEHAAIYSSASGRLDITDGGVDTNDGYLGLSRLYFDNGTDNVRLEVDGTTKTQLNVVTASGLAAEFEVATLDTTYQSIAATSNASGGGIVRQRGSDLFSYNRSVADGPLTDGVATQFANWTHSNLTGATHARIHYSVMASSGSDYQQVTGVLVVSMVSQGSPNITLSQIIDEAGVSEYETGTLDVTFSADDGGPSNTIELSCLADSSLSTPTIQIRAVCFATGETGSNGSYFLYTDATSDSAGTDVPVYSYNPLGHAGHLNDPADWAAFDLVHIATEDDDHAIELDVFSSGYGGVKGIDVFYNSGSISAGEDEAAILVQFDETSATGGDLTALEVLTTTEGTDQVIGLFAGVGVDPLEHQSGTFGDMDSIVVLAVDQLSALQSGGAGNVSVFVGDNDTVTIGDAAEFYEIEFILGTGASGSGVAPTFEYSTGSGPTTWAAFAPVDGTNGFKNSGVVAWLDADIPSWANGDGSERLIRITRTRNSLTTTPILDEIQISAPTLYEWDKDANLTTNTVYVGADKDARLFREATNRVSVSDGGVDTADGQLGCDRLVFDNGSASVAVSGNGTDTDSVWCTDPTGAAFRDLTARNVKGDSGFIARLAAPFTRSGLTDDDGLGTQTVGDCVALTDETATVVGGLNVPTDGYGSIHLRYFIICGDGTDRQSISGSLTCAVADASGTMTIDIDTSSILSTAATGGTLTAVFTAVENGAALEIKCNANTSITTPTKFQCSITADWHASGNFSWLYQ
jgi:hypothetical protein